MQKFTKEYFELKSNKMLSFNRYLVDSLKTKYKLHAGLIKNTKTKKIYHNKISTKKSNRVAVHTRTKITNKFAISLIFIDNWSNFLEIFFTHGIILYINLKYLF